MLAKNNTFIEIHYLAELFSWGNSQISIWRVGSVVRVYQSLIWNGFKLLTNKPY